MPTQTLLLALLALLFCSPALAADKVILVTNTYEPYVFTEGDRPGLFSEVVTAAFEAVGVEVVIQFRPWKRCEMLVREGRVFGAYPYSDTPQHYSYAWHSNTIWRDRSVFFYKRSRFKHYDFTSFEAMKELRIAGTVGNAYVETFQKAGLTLDMATTEKSGIMKIWESRADLFAEEEAVGRALIAKHFPDSQALFGVTPTAWRTTSLSIMVSKKFPGSKELMNRFNKGLQIIRSNGVYDRITAKYIDS